MFISFLIVISFFEGFITEKYLCIKWTFLIGQHYLELKLYLKWKLMPFDKLLLDAKWDAKLNRAFNVFILCKRQRFNARHPFHNVSKSYLNSAMRLHSECISLYRLIDVVLLSVWWNDALYSDFMVSLDMVWADQKEVRWNIIL